MERDFTDAKYQELVQYLAKESNGFWDSVADLDLADNKWVGNLGIERYFNEIDAYYRLIFDRYDTTAAQIENIFISVRELDDIYAARMKLLRERGELLKRKIDTMSDLMGQRKAPFSEGAVNFQMKEIENKLRDSLKKMADIIIEKYKMDTNSLSESELRILGKYVDALTKKRVAGKALLTMDTVVRDKFLLAYEIIHPEHAQSMQQLLIGIINDPAYQEDVAYIRYIAYTADEPARTLFFRYVDGIRIVDYDYNGKDKQHYKREINEVYVDLVNNIKANGTIDGMGKDDPRGSYVTFFHEMGHAIDDLATEKKKADATYMTWIYQNEDGLALHDVVISDVRNHLEASIQSYAAANGLSLTPAQQQDVLEEIMKYNSDDNKYATGTEERKLYDKIRINYKNKLKDEQKYNGISDVYGGVTGNTIRGKYKHDVIGYWYDANGNDYKNQGVELFAHYFAREMTGSSTALAEMQKYFPNSVQLMDEIMESMLIKKE